MGKAVECWDCGGSGYKPYYHKIDNGVCYTCKGTGVWYESQPLKGNEAKRKAYADMVKAKKQLCGLFNEYNANKKQIVTLASEGNINGAGAVARRNMEIEKEASVLQAQVPDVQYVFKT